MTIAALEVTITAPIVSFRNPLYAGVQAGLPCPPPATVGGLLAAARGGWSHVDHTARFGMTFHAAAHGVDLETYHPLDASGRRASPTPKDREFLAGVKLTIWLTEDLAAWQAALRRPVWPLRLGRSQDLVGVAIRQVQLETGDGRQGYAIVSREASSSGALLQLPTAISIDRSRTTWNTYRYAALASEDRISGHWVDPGGQAVVLLPPTHPVHAEPVS